MILRECTAEKLKRMTKRKKIICFGAGGNLFHVFETYKKLGFEKRIAYVIDNDEKKQHTHIYINEQKIQIMPPEMLKNLDLNNHVLVITALKYLEIFSQIQNIVCNKKGVCYKAPNIRYGMTERVKRIMCKLPLRDYIVLNGEGDTYENAKALGEYIANNDYFGKYKLIWLCEHPERFRDTSRECFLNRKTAMLADNLWEVIRYFYYLGRAKYLVFENQFIGKLRSDQISVYLNHGSPPIKATKGIINLPKDLNYALSPSDFSSMIIREQYSINEQRLLVCGSPRTDTLFEEAKEPLGDLLECKRYNKIILWVPTFRRRKNTNRVDTKKAFAMGVPLIESEADLEVLRVQLEQTNTLLILKLHLLQDLSCIKIGDSDNIKVLSSELLENNKTNVYEVMKFADGMITDYSTIGFDYMLLNRPIAYTVDDFNDYKLGFSIEEPLSLMPGRKIDTIEHLLSFIQEVHNDVDEYADERIRVNKLLHDYPDGENSRRVCRLLGWEK